MINKMIHQGDVIKDINGRMWVVSLIEMDMFDTNILLKHGNLKKPITQSDLRDYTRVEVTE